MTTDRSAEPAVLRYDMESKYSSRLSQLLISLENI